MVLDNVWTGAQRVALSRPFGAPHVVMITTRNGAILPPESDGHLRHELDLLVPADAAAVLCQYLAVWWSGVGDEGVPSAADPRVEKMVEICHRHVLTLSFIRILILSLILIPILFHTIPLNV